MIDPECPDASALRAASPDAALAAGLAQHLARCPRCRDFAAAEAALQRAARRLAPALPSPALLRFRAERRRLELAQARVVAPLRLWRAIATVAGVAGLAWISRPLAGSASRFFPALDGPGSAGTASLALFALLALAALLGLWLNAVEAPE